MIYVCIERLTWLMYIYILKNNALPFLTVLGQGDKVFIELFIFFSNFAKRSKKKKSEIIENIVLFLLQRNNCPV